MTEDQFARRLAELYRDAAAEMVNHTIIACEETGHSAVPYDLLRQLAESIMSMPMPKIKEKA